MTDDRFTTTATLAATTTLVASVAIASAGFWIRWHTLPSVVDVVMSMTVLAPFALPKSLADFIGLTSPTSTAGVIPAVMVFWPMWLTLVISGIRLRRPSALAVASVLWLAASPSWFVVGVGLIGL